MMKRLDYDGKVRIIQRNYRIYKLLKYIKEYARQYRELVKGCKLYEAEKIMLYRYVAFKTREMYKMSLKTILYISIDVSGRGISRKFFEQFIPKLDRTLICYMVWLKNGDAIALNARSYVSLNLPDVQKITKFWRKP